MPVVNPTTIEVLDEGISQGRVIGVDFTGAGVTATVSGFRATVDIPSSSGPILVVNIFQADLGPPAWQGRFTLVDAAITPFTKLLVWQSPGPYNNKGSLADEAVMQPVKITSVEPGTGDAIVNWETPPMLTYSKMPTGEPLITASSVNPKDIYNRVFGPALRIGKVQGFVAFNYMVMS